jgi:hypothetical protein
MSQLWCETNKRGRHRYRVRRFALILVKRSTLLGARRILECRTSKTIELLKAQTRPALG